MTNQVMRNLSAGRIPHCKSLHNMLKLVLKLVVSEFESIWWPSFDFWVEQFVNFARCPPALPQSLSPHWSLYGPRLACYMRCWHGWSYARSYKVKVIHNITQNAYFCADDGSVVTKDRVAAAVQELKSTDPLVDGNSGSVIISANQDPVLSSYSNVQGKVRISFEFSLLGTCRLHVLCIEVAVRSLMPWGIKLLKYLLVLYVAPHKLQ